MNSESSNFTLARRVDIAQLQADFSATGRVHIPNVLDTITAETIYNCLATQERWNLAYNHAGKHVDTDAQAVASWSQADQNKLSDLIHAQASSGFQYHYDAIPVYDIYHKQLLPGHLLNTVFEFLNSPAFINFIKSVTADETINFADAQATRFRRNHFLTQHDDNVAGKNRRVAYVLNLTRGWRPDWGGALQFFDGQGHVEQAYMPTYNALNLFSVPQAHSVAYVTPFANLPRLSITGWLRAGVDPLQ